MQQTTYQNPLVTSDFPDPSVIATDQGFYAYATHDQFSPTLNNIVLCHSTDLVHWSEPTGALVAPPIWAQHCERYWCPQVVYVNGQYRLYYAADSDARDGMHLALATSDKPHDFTDIGTPLSGSNGTAYAMIDPCFFADPKSGRHYLYYGSAHEPIRAVELAADGHTVISDPVDVLWPRPGVHFETLREGTFVTYHSDHNRYYLWISGDNTWAENGYAVSVYWSNDPIHGFEPIPEPHIILKPNDRWDSPGQVCLVTDAAGNDWLFYHAVDTSDRYIPETTIFQRKMCMDRIVYTAEGWPSIAGNSPSVDRQPGPAIV